MIIIFIIFSTTSMKKVLFIVMMALIMLPFSADSQKRKKQQRKSVQKSVQQKAVPEVLEEIDEAEAMAFASSYFNQRHSSYDVSENKRFFTESSFKVLNSKINKMLKNYELQNEGDDPFLQFAYEGTDEGFGVIVTSLGDGIFVGKEAKQTEYDLDMVDHPYEITVACIKVVKVNGEYKISALFDLSDNKWVPGKASPETAKSIKRIIDSAPETPQKNNKVEVAKQQENNDVLYSCTTMPSFPGGDIALMNFLRDNLRYPEEAAKKNIHGKVIVQFVVEKNGKIGEVKIARGVSKELDRESVRVVKSLPAFNPGLNSDGDPVRVWYTLPITFKTIASN